MTTGTVVVVAVVVAYLLFMVVAEILPRVRSIGRSYRSAAITRPERWGMEGVPPGGPIRFTYPLASHQQVIGRLRFPTLKGRNDAAHLRSRECCAAPPPTPRLAVAAMAPA